MTRVKLRCIMGCPGLKNSYREKGLLTDLGGFFIEGEFLKKDFIDIANFNHLPLDKKVETDLQICY